MTSRRRLLQAAAIGFPTIVKASALGLNNAVPPSDRVTLATVGVGWMGSGHVEEFLKCSGLQYVALADLDGHHLTENKAVIDTHYGDQLRRLPLVRGDHGRRDIDAVSIAVPDHWHGLVAFSGARRQGYLLREAAGSQLQ